MGFRFIDIPKIVANREYERAIGHLVNHISRFPGVAGIIRFGHATMPGISDIDMLVVFEDGMACHEDPLAGFPPDLAHLLSHGIDAMSYQFFRQTPGFTFWFNSECIWGDRERLQTAADRDKESDKTLKRQTAVEYLITNYMDLTLQCTYGIVKLRSMLQHLKGLRYDLEFLDIRSGRVWDAVTELRGWIAAWSVKPPEQKHIDAWIRKFRPEFERLADEMTRQYPVYVPRRDAYLYARNIVLKSGPRLSAAHHGLRLPASLAFGGRKYFNLQHRLNKWTFFFPMRHEADAMLENRFEYFRRMKAYNQVHFPRFSHLTTGFSVNFG